MPATIRSEIKKCPKCGSGLVQNYYNLAESWCSQKGCGWVSEAMARSGSPEKSKIAAVPTKQETTMSFASDLVDNTEATLASLDDKEWHVVMRFFLESMVAKRPNDLVRIIWARAHRIAAEDKADALRVFQLIMRDLELTITQR